MKRVKIKNIALVKNGSTPSSVVPEYYDGNIIWITPKDLSLQNSKYISKGERTISQKGLESCSSSLVPEGTILLSSRAPIGLLSIAKNELCTNQGFKNIIPDNVNIYGEYLYYYLKNSIKDIERLGSGTTFKEVSKNSIDNYHVFIPDDIVYQEKIASVLSSLDSKIEINNRINSELESLAKTIYNYWFVQFDFPDKNGKPYKSSGGRMEWNEQLKRKIPKGWKCIELSKVISKISTGLNPRKNFILGNGSNYYVTIKNIENGKVILDDRCDKIDDEVLTIINRRSDLKIGDILFTSIQPVGLTYLIQEEPTNWNINESVFSLRPNYELMTYEFAYLLLSNSEIKIFTRNSSAGSIHKGIRISVLKTFKFALGGKEVISDFSNIINPILKKIHLINKENQKLAEIRDWLLPMLMNGQVTVNDSTNEL